MALTALTWRFRFEVADHPINQTSLEKIIRDDPQNAKKRRLQIVEDNDEAVIQIGGDQPNGHFSSVTVPIPGSLELRNILIRCDYRWKNVVHGQDRWMLARGVFSDRTNGSWSHPPDHGLFSGEGTQDWKHLDLIRELPEAGIESRLNFDMLGTKGLLEVKNFRILKVRERFWFPSAKVLLSIAWIAWIYRRISSKKNLQYIRKSIASLIFFVACWITIFPQTSTLFSPVWGEFDIGGLEKLDDPEKPASPALQNRNLIPKPTPWPIPKTTSDPKPTFSVPKKTSSPKPTSREVTQNKIAEAKNQFNQAYRGVVHQRQYLHVFAYAIFAFVFLIITGRAQSIYMVLGVGILSELVPPIMRYGASFGDLIDLTMNLVGLAIGFFIWKKINNSKGERSLRPRAFSD